MTEFQDMFNSAPSSTRRSFLVGGQYLLRLDSIEWKTSENPMNAAGTKIHIAGFTIIDCENVSHIDSNDDDTGAPIFVVGDVCSAIQKVEIGLSNTPVGQKAVQRQLGNIKDMLLALLGSKLLAIGNEEKPTFADITHDVFMDTIGPESTVTGVTVNVVCQTVTTKSGGLFTTKVWQAVAPGTTSLDTLVE